MRRRMSLGIGYGKSSDSRGYDGHVVALIEGRYIMDLTLDQASGRRRRSACGPPARGHDGFAIWPATAVRAAKRMDVARA